MPIFQSAITRRIFQVIIVACAFSCAKADADEREDFYLNQLIYHPGTRIFTGVVDGRYDVVLKLYPTSNSGADMLGGSYYFTAPDAMVIRHLPFLGQMADGKLSLNEQEWNSDLEMADNKPAFEFQAGNDVASWKYPTRLKGFWLDGNKSKYCELRERHLEAPTGSRWVQRAIKRDFPRSNYTFNIVYPALEIAGGSVAQRAGFLKCNTAIERLVYSNIKKFRAYLDGYQPVAPSPNTGKPEDKKIEYKLTIGGDVIYSTKSFSTVDLNAYAETGGTHGMEWRDFATYDFRTNTEVKLGDLFKPKVRYLDSLARLCRIALDRRLAESERSSIREGSAPKPENYSKWGLSPTGLSIFFYDNQVTSSPDVSHLVVIPYSQLQGIMKPEIYQRLQQD